MGNLTVSYLLIGTYSEMEEEGIFLYKFDTSTGEAQKLSAISGIKNPSFLCLSPDEKYVYAVSERHEGKDGEVYAYRFDKENGKLIFLNKARTEGDDPCNLVVDQTGRWLYITNYGSGSIAVFGLDKNGSLASTSPVQLVQHKGKGPNRERQQEPHPHSVLISPDGKDLFSADLGVDKIFRYKIDQGTGELSPADQPFIETPAGAGPRILRFNKSGSLLYAIHELGGQVTVYKKTSGAGLFKEVELVSNLPVNFKEYFTSADIHLSPHEKFLYASNRDQLNDIVTYKLSEGGEKLIPVYRQPTGGKTPRSFVLTPDGKYVLVGHQNSEDITVFLRDPERGSLRLTRNPINVARAVCLIMVPANETSTN